MKIYFFIQTLFVSFVTLVFFTCTANAQAAFYKFKIGEREVIALLDGTVSLDAEKLFSENPVDKVQGLLKSAYLSNPVETSINAFLIIHGNRLILVDAGSGELFGPAHGGRLIYSLQAAGYRANQITDILLTHIHNDHSGGLTLNAQAVFPNATIHVSKLDLDYWLDEKRMEVADPNELSSNKSSFVNAIKVFRPYLSAGKVKPFQGDVELFQGLRTVATEGHTPGHTVFVLKSGKDQLVFCGDLVHVAGVQFANPELRDGFDVDKAKAVAQRLKLYREAAEKGFLIAADHISYPGIGRLKAQSGGYEWVPAAFSLEARTK